MEHLAVQLIVAICCAYIATILIPRQVPGRFLGLMVVGLVGVWLGESMFRFLKTQYGLSHAFLRWAILGVPIVPSIVGSVVVLYIITTLVRGRRYTG